MRTSMDLSVQDYQIIGSGDGEGDDDESGEAVASVGGDVGEIEVADTSDVDSGNGSRSHGDSLYQHTYDMQQVSGWVEQRFSLLLMIVFIRHHLTKECSFNTNT
ncbi:hypothetical protein Tco_0999402, partial [Tanacetum coccineum]